LATHRVRQLLAAFAVTLFMAMIAAGPAAATDVRVEAPKGTVFQGNVTPFVGTLQGHTTKKKTALGALIAASRTKPFSVKLNWSDSFGGSWNGFFLDSIAGVSGSSTTFWAVKVNQKLTSVGIGAATVTATSKVLVYHTTFDSVTFATKPTLGIGIGQRKVDAGASVTISVAAFDDAGTSSAAANAWVWVNGVGTQANANGKVTVRLSKGRYQVRATKPGTIRSRTLWVQAG
jgi:hypothetical protein